jgi:hypothetical protein
MEGIARFFRDLCLGKDSRREACDVTSDEKLGSPSFSSGDAVEGLEPQASNKRPLNEEGSFEDYGICG